MMWMNGLFVIDTKQESFAFRLHNEKEVDRKTFPKYPEFLHTSERWVLTLFRPDNDNRIKQAFQQQHYNKIASKDDTFGNVTFATDAKGEEALLRGHVYKGPTLPSLPTSLTTQSPSTVNITLTMTADGLLAVKACNVEPELCGCVVKEVSGAWYHPVYLNPDMMSLPGNMVKALDILKLMPDSYPGIPKLKEIVAAHSDLVRDAASAGDAAATKLEPFIVVEGMDATGKSTLVANLCKRLGAIELCSPPPIMADIRQHFDGYPTLVRRTYYSLGNYILGLQVAAMRREKPVVMDRYWHSTASYAIASECGYGDVNVLPPTGHQAYCWPEDLHQPSIVIYLTVSEETRIERMTQRLKTTLIETTAEEVWLKRDEKLRKRIAACYERMGGCGVTEVDASGSKEQVLQRVMDVLNKHNVL